MCTGSRRSASCLRMRAGARLFPCAPSPRPSPTLLASPLASRATRRRMKPARSSRIFLIHFTKSPARSPSPRRVSRARRPRHSRSSSHRHASSRTSMEPTALACSSHAPSISPFAMASSTTLSPTPPPRVPNPHPSASKAPATHRPSRRHSRPAASRTRSARGTRIHRRSSNAAEFPCATRAASPPPQARATRRGRASSTPHGSAGSSATTAKRGRSRASTGSFPTLPPHAAGPTSARRMCAPTTSARSPGRASEKSASTASPRGSLAPAKLRALRSRQASEEKA